MHVEFWDERWRKGHIGFHQAAVDKYLVAHWAALGVPQAARVFVPLCGKSLDLTWLAAQGHEVTGVEMSGIAVQSFLAENGIPARRRSVAGFDVYESAGLQLWCGDFFLLERAQLGNPLAVFDRAALSSWQEGRRQAYVERMTDLTRPGVNTLLVTLEYPQHQTPGPPFAVTSNDVRRLYSAHHAIRELSRHDILAGEPRMRARGVTSLQEVCHLLTRL